MFTEKVVVRELFRIDFKTTHHGWGSIQEGEIQINGQIRTNNDFTKMSA